MVTKPLILLIFANDHQAYLEGISKERQQLVAMLSPPCNRWGLEVDAWDYATVETLVKALNLKRERLAVLHFAGHSETDLLHLDEGKAHAKGLAAKLGECPNLKMVFLNGCKNAGLVKAIAEAGIPNVIGTHQPIGDDIAKYFSHSFFQALVEQQHTISDAFTQAQRDVQTKTEQNHRSLDINNPASTPDWAWFMVSSLPNWRFAEVATPCNRLPVLPHGELPATPFKNLYYYTEADAEIFFGRCRAILEVLQLLDDAKEPLVLLHGGTGVGKSSFLQAGLIPRLKAPTRQQTVRYIRYNDIDQQQDLLTQLFDSHKLTDIQELSKASVSSEFPAIWIIDQMEEIFFAHENIQDSKSSVPPALDILLKAMKSIFYPMDGSKRPNVKLILSLRKEWFAELHDACREYGINHRDYLLKPLDKQSIIEIIETPTEINYLRQHYRLQIINPPDGWLAQQIADDLLIDKQSNIAPTLQIILSRLWKQVENQQERVWDESLYLHEKRAGLLLEDYFDQQLNDIAIKESWGKEAYESGLLLDVLHSHITPQGTTKAVYLNEYDHFYSHISYRRGLLKALKDHYLIIEPQIMERHTAAQVTRIAHDTLAELIKNRFDISDLPGQRLFRIIAAHQAKDYLLSQYELETYEKAKYGMMNLNKENLEIITASRKKHKLGELIQEIITNVLFAVMFVLTLVFLQVKLPWT